MLKTTIWVFAVIFVIDIFINTLFQMPSNKIQPDAITQYFDYGRSIESKVLRMLGSFDEDMHPLSSAGWFQKPGYSEFDTNSSKDKVKVFVYGMSFSNRVASIISELSVDTYYVQTFAGPGAPLNHSYAYFDSHRPNRADDVVILGILASSLPKLSTVTHMTWNFERPGAHFYPRIRLDEKDQLVSTDIFIDSTSKLRESMSDDKHWEKVKQKIRANDAYYDSITFERDYFDFSTFGRLLRRAWAQRQNERTRLSFVDERGFKNEERMIEVASSIISKFAHDVRNDKAIPYVILFNDRGYSDYLYKALSPVLAEEEVSFYSTHRNFPAENLDNFLPDGHFTDEIDKQIGEAVFSGIQRKRGKRLEQ